MSKSKHQKEDSNFKKIIKVLIPLLIVLGLIFALNFNKWFKNTSKRSFEEQEIDANAGEYVKEKAEKNNEKNVIMPGWRVLHIKANTTNITRGIDFYNPKENDGYYYLKFKLIVNGETLYESGLVAPNKHIQHITLSKPLSEGTYDATVFIQPYKWDKKTPTNNGQVNIRLEVSS